MYIFLFGPFQYSLSMLGDPETVPLANSLFFLLPPGDSFRPAPSTSENTSRQSLSIASPPFVFWRIIAQCWGGRCFSIDSLSICIPSVPLIHFGSHWCLFRLFPTSPLFPFCHKLHLLVRAHLYCIVSLFLS